MINFKQISSTIFFASYLLKINKAILKLILSILTVIDGTGIKSFHIGPSEYVTKFETRVEISPQ